MTSLNFLKTVAKLFNTYERHGLTSQEAKETKETLDRFAQKRLQIVGFKRFDEESPPENCRFDAWGRIWEPATDQFRWDRFPEVYLKFDKTIGGLPDHAIKYRIDWWCSIAVPPGHPKEGAISIDL